MESGKVTTAVFLPGCRTRGLIFVVGRVTTENGEAKLKSRVVVDNQDLNEEDNQVR
jgi:hypothetical protein